ncbi:MAG: peptidoglycan editing factor PgeF [Nocardioidaceae bacterium]
MFAFQDSRDRIDVAFTDRHGGTSGGPYASLNLAEVDATQRDEVAENVRLAARALTGAEPPVLRMRQVHGSDVHVVVSVDDAVPVADAMVTARPGVVLMVRVADCVPVVLADAGRGIVGVAHAGRPGMAAGVVPNTVAAMRDLGAADLVAWVGPHVCGRCYEVPAEMRAEVSALVPEAYAETSWGTAALDIGAGVRAQLRSAGVAVVDAARCTVEDEDLYSYRRQGKQSGRMAGLVWARP